MKKGLLFLVIVLLGMSACRVVPPTVTGVRAFQLAKDNTGRQALRFEIRVNNPNMLGFRVDDPVFDVFLNSKKLASAYNGKPIRVKARSHEYYGVFLGTELRSWVDFLGPAITVLTSGKAEFEVKGDLTARFLFWKKSLPVSVKESVSIKELLK